MAEIDLFDLTGLPFDPPEKSAKKVKTAIDKKRKELGALLSSSSQDDERKKLNAQIAFLKSVSEDILTPDGMQLNEDKHQALADKRVDSELKKLKATASLMSQSGSLSISEGMIKFHKKERRLSDERVREAFTELGFSIVDIDLTRALPKFPTRADSIRSWIATLSSTKDPNPDGPDTSLVTDLYSFAAYLEGEPENAALYRSKSTAELCGLFDSYSKKFSMHNDDFSKLRGDLSANAKTYVFNSDENRQAYQDYLNYYSPAMTALFESIHGTPETLLYDAKFAEPCIKRISEVFGNYETALAIYNKEATLDPPYIRPNLVYHIKCDYCGRVSEFASEKEAQKANQCTNCGKSLFKKCGKCGSLIPVSREKCPHCGFVFAGAVLFEKHYRAAEAALRESDFDAARKHLYDAQSADPSEKQRVEQFMAKIEAREKKYAQPINKLRELVAGKRFTAAGLALYETIRQYPGLNVSAFETQIRAASAKADSRFEASKKLPPARQADECVAILRDCVDHQPAMDFLRTHPPLPCKSLTLTASAGGGVSVSWGTSGESGVTYRLERSADNRSGESRVLQDQTVSTSHVDQTAKPGILYTYTVFSIRFGVSSAPTKKSIILHSDVSNFHAVQNRDCIRLTWDAPENSVGATVTRSVAGKTAVLSRSAYVSLEDRDVRFGIAYMYTIQANYPDSTLSPGIESVITPLLIIDSFKIKVTAAKDNFFKVSWDIRQPGVDLRIMANGKLNLECKSDSGSAQIKLPAEAFTTVSVMAYSGGAWVSSDNSVEVNTYTPCAIDRNMTELREESISTPQGSLCSIEIKIKMAEPIPRNALGFYYAVRTASDSSRWAATDDIGRASDIRRVSLENYKSKNEIVYTESVKDEMSFYISVFTIYGVGGKEVISEPKTLRLDRPVFADLFWKVSKGIFSGMKLSIDVSANRPLDRIPDLALCACYDNEFISSHDDSRSIVLKQLPEINLETPQKFFSRTYDVDCGFSGKELKRMKLFLFETAPVRSEKFTLRWQQGFMGKV